MMSYSWLDRSGFGPVGHWTGRERAQLGPDRPLNRLDFLARLGYAAARSGPSGSPEFNSDVRRCRARACVSEAEHQGVREACSWMWPRSWMRRSTTMVSGEIVRLHATRNTLLVACEWWRLPPVTYY